jgi:plasmid stabilization system protein ParE
MIWRIIIRPKAQSDLDTACDWYEAQQEGLGSKFLAEVDHAIETLRERPESFPLYYRDFRRVLLSRFPYKLFFRIVDERVIVFRILHASRNHPPALREPS